jgi:hypothetical protein
MGFTASRRRSGRLGVEIWVGGSHTARESGLQNGCGRSLVSERSRLVRARPTPRRCTPMQRARGGCGSDCYECIAPNHGQDRTALNDCIHSSCVYAAMPRDWQCRRARTKRSLNPKWRYTASVGARRTDASRGGPSSSNHLSCFPCFTCRPSQHLVVNALAAALLSR